MADKSKLNFSFAGCGFLGIYHFGVAACIKKYTPYLIENQVSGASAGALAAVALVADFSISDCAKMWINACVTTRSKVIGPFSPSSDVAAIARKHLDQIVPKDAHLTVNGRLNVSMTRVRDLQNVIVSHFESKEDLIDGLICAITIPLCIGTIPPKYHGERCVDGGFSNNVLILDEHTVTIAPYSGESDICPRDNSSLAPWVLNANNTSIEVSTKNLYRITDTFIPPRPQRLAQICQKGYDDTLRYLIQNNLIGCTVCILSTEISNKFDQDATTDDDDEVEKVNTVTEIVICGDCETIKEFANKRIMPEQLLETFQIAIEEDTQGVLNQLREYKIVKIFNILTLPMMISIDFAYATTLKIQNVPSLILPHLEGIPKMIKPHINAFQEALIPL